MNKLNSFESLGHLFGVEPSEESTPELDSNTIDFTGLDLRVGIKRLGGGKQISIVTGFDEDSDLAACAKELKVHCGTGGSVKDNEIMIQGNHRDKIREFFLSKGAKVKLAGG